MRLDFLIFRVNLFALSQFAMLSREQFSIFSGLLNMSYWHETGMCCLQINEKIFQVQISRCHLHRLERGVVLIHFLEEHHMKWFFGQICLGFKP